MNRFTEVVVSGLVAFTLIDAGSALAQGSSVQSRTQAIVASFNKSKHVVKEKRGVRMEKYKDVRSAAAIRNVRDYAGSYEVYGMGMTLDLRVDANGNVSANGYDQVNLDSPVWRGFTLGNARIQSALLTATKVHANGATEPFEGVFINRTSFDSPTDKGVTQFGLGVVSSSRLVVNGVSIDRVLFERKNLRMARVHEEATTRYGHLSALTEKEDALRRATSAARARCAIADAAPK